MVDPTGLCTGSRITDGNGNCAGGGKIPGSASGTCDGGCDGPGKKNTGTANSNQQTTEKSAGGSAGDFEIGVTLGATAEAEFSPCLLNCPNGDIYDIGRIGKEGEAAVRSQFNIGSRGNLVIEGRKRFPDGLSDTDLSEVKNVARLAFTGQLRAYLSYTQTEGLRFNLYARSNTQLSGPLARAIREGLINRRTIPGK